ncbi:cadherin-like beta sandwich domain-containing protein [Carboxylicivirga caseinilyticus]|uniref:cadherin-like beta sandwich domain-containing protein n=1 Tax=Carboxylicivirga caseinilyticus TaxID=3417572 RepID=UPI003D3324BD|nr:T9SS type A sorting domain-containing protein [Marinilabiliaceae bacterium A049]
MKKRFLLFSLLFAMTQFFVLQAQTDVTDTYLTNPGFDSNCTYTISSTDVNLGTADDGSTIMTVDGWTGNYNGWSAGATFEYTTVTTLNGNTVPTADPDGASGTTEGGLGVCAAWAGSTYYTQSVTLPAGTYTLKYKVNNFGPVTAGTSLAGFTPDAGTASLSTLSDIAIDGSWVTDEITFVLTAETTGVIQIGILSVNAGSGGNGRFIFDDVQLFFTAEVDKSNLQSLVDEATTMYSNQEAVPEGSTVYADLNTAIVAAQAVLDNTEATLAEVVAEEEALQAAITDVENAIELQQKITTWTTLPYDATSEIVNPSFETGNTDGWVNVGGFVGQSNTSFSLKAGTYYVEKWQSSGNWSGLKLSQVIENIPNGVYKLTAAALNNPEGTGGAFVYANDVTAEVLATAEYTLEVVVDNNTLEIGYDIVNSGNYIAVDNFRLSYISDGSPVIDIAESYLAFDEFETTATLTVTGYNLTENIALSAPTGFSLDVSSLASDATGESVTVTFDASATTSGNIELTSGTATASIPVYARLNSDKFTPYFGDRENLVADAYCSDRSLYGGWGSVVTTTNEAEVYCGKASIKLGTGDTGCDAAFDINPFAYKANTTYRVRAMVKTVDGSIGFLANSADPNYNDAFDTGGEWQQIDFYFSTGAAPSASFVTFNKCDNGSNCTYAYIDNYEIYEVNNDATLSAITLNVGGLDIAFDPATTTYTATVPSGTETVTVDATLSDESAMISGTGDVDVSTGTGVATIVVTAESGAETTYTVTINVDSATKLSKIDQNAVKVYPTLTTSGINVEFSDKPGMIKLYSLSGQLIKTVKATSQIETIQLSTAGIYLVEVESNGAKTILKVVKK